MPNWQQEYQEYVNIRSQLSSALRRYELDAAVVFGLSSGLDQLISPLVGTAPPDPDEPPYLPHLRETLVRLHQTAVQARSSQTLDLPNNAVANPLDNVYEAAFAILRDESFNNLSAQGYSVYNKPVAVERTTTTMPVRVFRGQTHYEWLIPTLYRRRRENRGKEIEEQEMRKRLAHLQSFVTALEHSPLGQNLNHAQRVAVARHYSMPTSYLDVTSDAFVALYFAASAKGGDERGIGVVYNISVPEWSRYAGSGEPPVGRFDLIEVPGLPRLERQKGLFLVGAHRDIMAQYVPQVIAFRRQDLPFEDISRGVTTNRLLPPPDKDPYRQFAEQVRLEAVQPEDIAVSDVKRELGLARTAYLPLKANDYRKLALSWRTPTLSPREDRLLTWLCRFYALARQQALAAGGPGNNLDRDVNIHRFHDWVTKLRDVSTLPKLLAAGFYLSETYKPALDTLRKEPDWPQEWD